jgi:hypothetical protein
MLHCNIYKTEGRKGPAFHRFFTLAAGFRCHPAPASVPAAWDISQAPGAFE